MRAFGRPPGSRIRAVGLMAWPTSPRPRLCKILLAGTLNHTVFRGRKVGSAEDFMVEQGRYVLAGEALGTGSLRVAQRPVRCGAFNACASLDAAKAALTGDGRQEPIGPPSFSD